VSFELPCCLTQLPQFLFCHCTVYRFSGSIELLLKCPPRTLPDDLSSLSLAIILAIQINALSSLHAFVLSASLTHIIDHHQRILRTLLSQAYCSHQHAFTPCWWLALDHSKYIQTVAACSGYSCMCKPNITIMLQELDIIDALYQI
jgi:hypothetical protein